MRILGATVRDLTPSGGRGALAALDAAGRIATLAAIDGLPALTREAARLAAGEPFLLAADLAIVQGPGKSRRVDGWVHRRLGVRLGALRASGLQGGELVAALAAAGQPGLPYPDRDRRRTGLVEIHPELVLKALLWESSAAAAAPGLPDREEILRALDVPVYRGPKLARASWAERFALLDRAMRMVSGTGDLDGTTLRDELTKAVTVDAVDRAAAAFDAALLAVAARRYLEEPERCAFVGDRETGYTVLPADAFLRRVVLREPARADRGALFPKASLRDRLGSNAEVRPLELLDLPGRAQHFEAVFRQTPLLEFDNVDEMLWWKHTRHLDGPEIPSEGLREMVVRLESAENDGPLRLTRSRHKTLSFRFEPPQTWRARIAPRDGRTYPFRVLRATYEV